ncbi:MAG TPA: M28 family peptidase [Candidatus Acidoferrales bacterium]|nr:M28 family peptidase [Candidatus Acidoferrales bacterium]
MRSTVRLRRFALLLIVLPSFLILGGSAQVPTHFFADAPATAISAQRIQADINYLASPRLKGRDTGTPENNRAAKYIADQFHRAGLEPLAADGSKRSFFQYFTVTVGAKLGKENRLQADRAGASGVSKLRVGEDFQPFNYSENGEAHCPVVFAGFGITAPEYHYDDYQGLEVKDKAVVVMRNEPQKDDEKSIFDGRQPTQYSALVNKAINARNHGARAMILVNDAPGPSENDALMPFDSLSGPQNPGILLVQVKRSVVDGWLAPSGKTLAALQKPIDEKLEPQSAPIEGVTLDFRVDVQHIHATTQNVVAVLRGSDPQLAAEAVLVGAHYDHLGLGRHDALDPDAAGQVHPGADDNASGTAAVLELARELAARRSELKRSVVFLTFSGEELGLLGSAYYTAHPLWPLEKTATMLNLDMVGRVREGKLYVGGTGTSPVFPKILEAANSTGLRLESSRSGYGSSDHTSFYVKDIPVLFFFSGLHEDYHRATDTPEKIAAGEEARVTDLAFRALLALASAEARPQFTRVVEPRPMGATGGGGGYGAYFGSIPDMGAEIDGVKFADVRDASPAAKAGLKRGDVLVEFAGAPIKNLYDFTFQLRAHRPGEEVRVVVLRDGQRVEATVKLEVRH